MSTTQYPGSLSRESKKEWQVLRLDFFNKCAGGRQMYTSKSCIGVTLEPMYNDVNLYNLVREMCVIPVSHCSYRPFA